MNSSSVVVAILSGSSGQLRQVRAARIEVEGGRKRKAGPLSVGCRCKRQSLAKVARVETEDERQRKAGLLQAGFRCKLQSLAKAAAVKIEGAWQRQEGLCGQVSDVSGEV
ncbi:hypothetical protein NDU88_008382 [Pleurodeles waltl]|uniref:Uncharacterized protein n=1 Tax=Pleurodeles waltl TaxID=8319 RepID=A0AAV7PT00_PLEWA|nr:hypothetical protein NDU88_008382 [Pleurodeles waltl]